MNNRSRSSLFLMEQLIVIAVFAVCAAVCVKIFAGSFIMASDSRDMRNALLIAESGAECYKATSGDAEKTATLLGGSVSDNEGFITVYYDEEWQASGEGSAYYVMRLINKDSEEAKTSFGDIEVQKITGEEIISFTVAVRRET